MTHASCLMSCCNDVIARSGIEGCSFKGGFYYELGCISLGGFGFLGLDGEL